MLVGTYPLKVALLGGIVGFTITALAIHLVKAKLAKKDIYCNLTIFFNNNEITTKALIDTGNMLKDPISKMPVIIVDKEVIRNILPDVILDNLEKIIGGDAPKEIYEDENLQYITRFRLIPFSSIGKQNGMLLGFKANKIEIEQNEEKINVENVVVGIYNNKLSKKNQYFALIGLDLLEGSDENNELTTNVSR